MKRILTITLTLVLLFGLFSVVGSATLYSATRDVANSFFQSNQRGAAPSLEEADTLSPVIYDYQFNAQYGACAAGSEVNINPGAEEATARILLVGTYIFEDDDSGARWLEMYEGEEYEANEENIVVAQVSCLYSQAAAKTQHYGLVRNCLDYSSTSAYELNIVSDYYYDFYGNDG